MDLRQLKSAPDQLVLLGIGILALIYVGTGPRAWAEDRWATAAGAAAGAIGMLKSGQLIGRKEGWDEGYNTLNPSLHVEDIIAYTGPVAEPSPPPKLELQQRDPRGGFLPSGWWIDERGRYRDQNNRVANDERRIATLAAEAQS